MMEKVSSEKVVLEILKLMDKYSDMTRNMCKARIDSDYGRQIVLQKKREEIQLQVVDQIKRLREYYESLIKKKNETN